MAQRSFQRQETKYILKNDQLNNLLLVIDKRMSFDKYCASGMSYPVNNIYFDNSNFYVVRRSIDKPKFKAKMRLRQYGSEDKYYLELKRKVQGVVYKRRICLNSREKDSFLERLELPQRQEYLDRIITREITNYLRVTPGLKPSVGICYDRLAYVGPNELRMTVDNNLRASREWEKLSSSRGRELLPSDTFLLEVKYRAAIPLWLAEILAANRIYPASFSKYGYEYKTRDKERENYVSIGI